MEYSQNSLKIAMSEADCSVVQLVEKSGLSRRTIDNLLNQRIRSNPTVDTLHAIGKALNINPLDLLRNS